MLKEKKKQKQQGINLNILECKVIGTITANSAALSINLNILECKDGIC